MFNFDSSTIDSSLISNLSLSSIHIPKKVEITRENIDTYIDKDTLFRWTYIPFVISDIMFDYIDSLKCYLIMNKISDFKKDMRQLKEIQSECEYYKRIHLEQKYCEKECEQSFQLQEDLTYLFNDLHRTLVSEITDKSDDYKYLVSAAYISLALYKSIIKYNSEQRTKLFNKLKIETKDVMCRSFQEAGSILKSIASALYSINDETISKLVTDILKSVNSIILFNSPEELKEAGL